MKKVFIYMLYSIISFGSINLTYSFGLSNGFTVPVEREGLISRNLEVTSKIKDESNNTTLDRLPRNIIDTDDRRLIIDTLQAPYNGIAKLKITIKNKKNEIEGDCTGFFIDGKTLLTAGHCIYNSREKTYASSIKVIPAMTPDLTKKPLIDYSGYYHYSLYYPVKRPFGEANAVRMVYPMGLSDTVPRLNDDYAILYLDTDFGEKVTHFGLNTDIENTSDVESNKDNTYKVAGYPGDKLFGTLWEDLGKIIKVEDGLISHDIDTVRGQSGSPIYRKVNDGWQAYGIHTGGYDYGYNTGVSMSRIKNNIDNGELISIIPDGVYLIRSALNTNKVMDLFDNRKGGNVGLWDLHRGDNQQWLVQWSDKKQAYRIRNKQLDPSTYNLACDINNSDRQDNVIMYDNNYTDQYWQFHELTNNYYVITNKEKPELAISVDKGFSNNGTNIRGYENIQSKNQQWKLEKIGEIPSRNIISHDEL